LIIAAEAGGNPFDEGFFYPWATLMDKFPNHPNTMACESATIELRGEVDVYDDFLK
jgi:hypothetical protein